MKDTRATSVLGTFFHKHKYISAPVVTPEDTVIAAAGNLAEALKGNLPNNLGESSLAELKCLGNFSSKPAAKPTQTGHRSRPSPQHLHHGSPLVSPRE